MEYIHINCDLGEGGKQDAEIMPLISACNIACGGHAGTLESMRETVALAMENNVEIGAHPSYPDKENFGRISMKMDHEDLKRSIVAQILSLKQITEAEGGKLHHIKPHGALYNDAAKDENIANIIIEAVTEFDENLPVYAMENSAISRLAKDKINVIFEAFGDRNYEQNYELISRQKIGAVITEKEEVFDHISEMFFDMKITIKNRKKLPCNATTFCVHSDNPKAVEILKYLHERFEQKKVKIKSF